MRAPRRVDRELGRMRLCRRCDEWYPETREFYYFEPKRPKVLHCRVCKSEIRLRAELASRNHLCPTCLAVRTPETECHGCAGRISGPLTVAKLREWGLAPVVDS